MSKKLVTIKKNFLCFFSCPRLLPFPTTQSNELDQ